MAAEQVGCDEDEATFIFENSLEELITQVTIWPDWHEHNSETTEERETHVGRLVHHSRLAGAAGISEQNSLSSPQLSPLLLMGQ